MKKENGIYKSEKNKMSNICVRQAKVEDASLILSFIKELADYEKAPHEVKASVSDIEEKLFSDDATTHALICTLNDEPIGFAVYFYNFSTWLGKNGLYLEDLYISQQHRKLGAGKTLIKHLANLAVQNKCGRFEWCVLDWNTTAINFYKSIGAIAQDEWTIYRLSGENLVSFAQS